MSALALLFPAIMGQAQVDQGCSRGVMYPVLSASRDQDRRHHYLLDRQQRCDFILLSS